ncbi:amidohydrolase family protein [Brevibacillus migulae]|uniref:amidohydrolase family protein n=1 Tax=Brevibacillus migulae TaxID=1644114 RepID=UPI00106E7D6F|nr:amidohydrolase family protein [Brevibacillus migulae]
MKKHVSQLLFFICLLTSMIGSASAASEAETDKEKPYAITHVTIVDVKEGKLQPDKTVVIEENEIVQVEPSSEISIPPEALIYNGTGKYLIPGLWDMHVHLLDDQENAFPYLLANGVTGVRDMGASLSQLDEWRKTIDAGTLAPRLFFSGPALDGAKTMGDGSLMQVNLKTEEEARAKVRELKEVGVNFVKVYTYLPRSLYLAIADEAQKQGLTFAGHVPFAVSAMEASDLGQKSIEHFYGILIASSRQEEEIRAQYANHIPYIFAVDLAAAQSFDTEKAHALFETFAKNQTYIVPTLATFHNLLADMDASRTQYAPTEVQKMWIDYQEKNKAGLEMSRSVIGRLYELYPQLITEMKERGVPIMAGTDTLWSDKEPIPSVFGFSLHDELELLVEAGLSPLEALQAATITPAKFLGVDDHAGSIEVGKWADLVLLDENPLEDISHSRSIAAVVTDGKLLDSETLQSMVKTYPSPLDREPLFPSE